MPHANWRGTYEMGTFIAANCKSVWLPSYEVVQQDSTGRTVMPLVDQDGNEYDVMQQRCIEIDAPGKYQGMSRFLRRQTPSGPISWMGTLVQDAQDASGLMYRRNCQCACWHVAKCCACTSQVQGIGPFVGLLRDVARTPILASSKVTDPAASPARARGGSRFAGRRA